MTDEEVIRTRNSEEMIRRLHLWPLGKVLPLKRSEMTNPVIAPDAHFGHISKDRPRVVIVRNSAATREGQATTIHYPSAAAIVASGWRVD